MKSSNVLIRISLLALFFLILNNSTFAQWTQVGQLTGLGGSISRISVVDSNIVWIVGGYPSGPIIYRTVNGGQNWTSVPTNGILNALSCISGKDSVTAFVGEFGRTFWRTDNAGLNWTLVDTNGIPSTFDDIVFSKTLPQYGVILSSGNFGDHILLWNTSNGGLNWTKSTLPGITSVFGVIYSTFIIDNLFFGFQIYNSDTVGSDSYMTNNGGSNWFRGGEYISGSGDIVFSDNKLTGIMVADSYLPNIRRTTNAGANWVTVNTFSNISGYVSSAWVSGTNTIFICSYNSTSNQNILRSNDGGLTWSPQNTSSVNNIDEIDYIRYNDLIVAYSTSSTGQVLKSRQTVQPVGINQIVSSIPTNFSLSQNYPNPFNPNTVISYQLPVSNFASLKIYDVLGNEVAALVNEKQNSGTYSVDWNASNYPSGIYFYKLDAGEFVQTKKMILQK